MFLEHISEHHATLAQTSAVRPSPLSSSFYSASSTADPHTNISVYFPLRGGKSYGNFGLDLAIVTFSSEFISRF